MTPLTPEQESSFRSWYEALAHAIGLNPNPDDPLHFYDYRGAFKAMQGPSVDPSDALFHWPSEFKSPQHPNRYVQGIDTVTGLPRLGPQRPNPRDYIAPLNMLLTPIGDKRTWR